MNRFRSSYLRLLPLPAFALVFVAAPAMAQAPVYAPAPQMAPPEPKDHNLWVGHLGVGWYGTRDVPLGAATISTPVVGMRYWMNSLLGIDAGLGFTTASGSNTNTAGVSADKASGTTFALHGGIPLALADGQHYSFEITPELDLGFGSGSSGAVDSSGFVLQVGGRVGGEVYFGFIGIPALALDASVGLFLRSSSSKVETGGQSSKSSDFVIATSSINQPWDIFRSNVAARYYF